MAEDHCNTLLRVNYSISLLCCLKPKIVEVSFLYYSYAFVYDPIFCNEFFLHLIVLRDCMVPNTLFEFLAFCFLEVTTQKLSFFHCHGLTCIWKILLVSFVFFLTLYFCLQWSPQIGPNTNKPLSNILYVSSFDLYDPSFIYLKRNKLRSRLLL